NRAIMDHFGLKNMEQLLRVVGDDFRYVEPIYCGPELRIFPDGSVEGYFGERYKYAEFEAGKYLEASYLPFAGVDRLEDLDRSHFPSADWFDDSTVREQAQAIRDQGFAVCCGTAGDIDPSQVEKQPCDVCCIQCLLSRSSQVMLPGKHRRRRPRLM
ncbi:MAG: hypothetical protein ACC645_14025, partial [Pirellulales bacterium]